MAPQASKKAVENYAAHDWREKRDSREKRNPKFRIRSSENSALRTADRFLHEQRQQFEMGSWGLLDIHDLIALSISIRRDQDSSWSHFHARYKRHERTSTDG